MWVVSVMRGGEQEELNTEEEEHSQGSELSPCALKATTLKYTFKNTNPDMLGTKITSATRAMRATRPPFH